MHKFTLRRMRVACIFGACKRSFLNTTFSLFFSRDADGYQHDEPSGWDVWEQTSEMVAAVISPCDTEQEAIDEMARIEKLGNDA